LIALTWPEIQRRYRRRAFRQLILRELQELKPLNPEERMDNWQAHQQKNFVHKRIFEAPSENRDFILSLSPDLVYYLSQLWDAREQGNPEQWLHFLERLAKIGMLPETGYATYDSKNDEENKTINESSIYEQWESVIKNYT
jgi:hypothetical protein